MAGAADQRKKEEERFFVERFLRGAGLEFAAEDHERPDFVLSHGEFRVGLEVTRIFHRARPESMPRQAVETLRDRVIREARQSYVAAGRPPVLVSVLFNSSAGFGKSDVSRLASKLFELVLRNFPEADSRTEEEYDWLNRDWFPEEFLHVSVSRFSFLMESYWSSPDAEYAPNCSTDSIQERISEEASKFSAYASAFPECWLLVVADDFRLSGSFQFPQETLEHVYSSPFSQAYLLEPFSSRVHPLKSRPVLQNLTSNR